MNTSTPRTLPILFGASLLLSLSMGMRQTTGLLVGPMTRDLGLLAADVTFAVALQNIFWGITQPFIGALADRYGVRPVTMVGALLFAGGMALAATAQGWWALTIGLGPMIGIGLSCTATSMAMSSSARAAPASKRSMVLGLVSAAGSLGTLVIAPMVQTVMGGHGWRTALLVFVALALVMLPAGFMTGGVDRIPRHTSASDVTLGATLRLAATNRPFIVLSLAYFVCGLQLVFLTTHLPTYLALCGMDPMLGAEALSVIGGCNVIGSWLFGWLGGKYPKHALLGGIYMVRSLAIAAYFVTPVSPASTLVFAAIMGLLWLGVVPLVSGLVAEGFGMRFMATLLGVAFLSHQLGSFLGAWAGDQPDGDGAVQITFGAPLPRDRDEAPLRRDRDVAPVGTTRTA
jgi:MFS family permease